MRHSVSTHDPKSSTQSIELVCQGSRGRRERKDWAPCGTYLGSVGIMHQVWLVLREPHILAEGCTQIHILNLTTACS